MEVRLKQIEEEQHKEREAEKRRRSKASAPYFIPSSQYVNHVYEDTGKGTSITAWHAAKPNLLSPNRREVPDSLPEGTFVILVLDNHGAIARNIRLSGDISKAQLKQEPDFDDSKRQIFLKYPFSQSQRGKTQKVIISFETPDGYDLTHTYQTRHGFFEFVRIDPA